jgi:hypothetical protein
MLPAAASSENDQGSMNLASNIAPLPTTMPSRVAPSTGAPDAAADAGRTQLISRCCARTNAG